MTNFITIAAAIAFGLFIVPVQAKDAPGEKIGAKLMCSEHSANPEKLRAFQRDIFLFVPAHN